MQTNVGIDRQRQRDTLTYKGIDGQTATVKQRDKPRERQTKGQIDRQGQGQACKHI